MGVQEFSAHLHALGNSWTPIKSLPANRTGLMGVQEFSEDVCHAPRASAAHATSRLAQRRRETWSGG